MPILNAYQFSGEIKESKDFAPTYLFVGDEETIIAESFHHFKIAFFARYGNEIPDFNVENLHADKDEVERIIESCLTLPIVSEKKLVIVHYLEKMSEQSQSALKEYCAAPNSSTCLVLLLNAKPSDATMRKELPDQVIKNGVAIKCWKPFESRRPQWIMEKVSQVGKSISFETAQLLSLEGGQSLGELASEIEKLVLFVGEKNEITLSDVKETMSFRRDRSIWDFIDHLEKGEIKKAANILGNCLEQGEEPIKILNLIARSCRRLSKNDPELFNELKRTDLLLKSGHGTESSVFEKILNRLEVQSQT